MLEVYTSFNCKIDWGFFFRTEGNSLYPLRCYKRIMQYNETWRVYSRSKYVYFDVCVVVQFSFRLKFVKPV